MAKLWERQTDPKTGREESDKAFQAFILYRDLPAFERSLEHVNSVWKASGRKGKGGSPESNRRQKSKRVRNGQVELWCTTWNWVLRARAWDNERDRARRQAEIDEEVAVGKRHAQLCAANLELLARPMFTILQRLQIDPTLFAGMKIDDLMRYAFLSARVIPRMMTAERVARGMDAKSKELEAKEAKAEGADSLPIEGFEFTWAEPNCVCGHRHSKHDQSSPDPNLVPCSVDRCECVKFQRADD